MFICSPLLSLTLEHDIHHQKLSEKPSPSAQHSLLHTPNPSSSPPANHLFKTLKTNLWKTAIGAVCMSVYMYVQKWEGQRERERVLTNSLPRSRAASLNIFLFPELLPQKTQTLLNSPIFSWPQTTTENIHYATKSSHKSRH